MSITSKSTLCLAHVKVLLSSLKLNTSGNLMELTDRILLYQSSNDEIKQILAKYKLEKIGNKSILVNRFIDFSRKCKLYNNLSKSPIFAKSKIKYKDLTNTQLKTLLSNYNLSTSGKNVDLLDRLINYKNPTPKKLEEKEDDFFEKIIKPNLDRSFIDFMESNKTFELTSKKSKTTKNGYIYILVAGSYDGRIKIGQTKKRNSINDVKKYLYNRYKTPLGDNLFVILFSSNDTCKHEKMIHTSLTPFQIGNSELFTCPINKAIEICNSTTGSYPIKY